jgi:peroxiredoxin (alkyl hydroperoxide reductase subunit C)
MGVAHSYGMVQPGASDTSAVRATFIIDDKVIVPPPATAAAAEARINEGYECTDWYFCKKAL